MEIRIKDEFIKLGQALKLAGVVEDGAQDAGQPDGAVADHVAEKQHAKQAKQASGQAVEEGHHAASKEGA